MNLTRSRKKPTALTKWKIKRITGAPRRLARRRGFGIHSPFAFAFVRRVLAETCGYYCYPRLGAEARAAGLSSRLLRLIFRLSLFFRPDDYNIIGGDSHAVESAIGCGMPSARRINTPSRFIVVIGGVADVSLPSTDEDVLIVVANPSDNCGLLNVLWAKCGSAMLFRGSKVAVIMCRRGLPRQTFNVWM